VVFLRGRKEKVQKLIRQNVQAASGGKTQVTGTITSPVEWDGKTKELEFLIVSALQQPFYFVIEFWEEFELPLSGQRFVRVAEVEPITTTEEDTSARQETAYKPHELTSEQETILKQLVATFPSCTGMGLDRLRRTCHRSNSGEFTEQGEALSHLSSKTRADFCRT